MNGPDHLPVAIIGGGLAGLTAAAALARHNVPFALYEAGPHIAGLARTFVDDEGFSHDFGAHFITNRLAAAIGASSRCRDVSRYGEVVWLRGRAISYPFGLMREPRFFASALAGRMSPSREPEIRTAAQWFCRRSAFRPSSYRDSAGLPWRLGRCTTGTPDGDEVRRFPRPRRVE